MVSDITQAVLGRALDASAMRHRAIANNMANVETPGYRRLDVDFEEQLRMALDSSNQADAARQSEVAQVQPAMREDNATPDRMNGNNVNPDHEMAILAENTIQYQALIRAAAIKGDMLRAAIYEGRK